MLNNEIIIQRDKFKLIVQEAVVKGYNIGKRSNCDIEERGWSMACEIEERLDNDDI